MHAPDDPRFAPLRELHALADERAAELHAEHGPRLRCARGCYGCCSDDLTVTALEAAYLLAQHPALFAEGEPAAHGGCALLDGAGLCRAYDARPYVCRTQGLPLRWLEELGADNGADDDDADGEIVERRDVCPLSEPGPALESLDEDAFHLLGPLEERLVVASEHAFGDAPRVALRSLFTRVSPERRLPVVPGDGATRLPSAD